MSADSPLRGWVTPQQQRLLAAIFGDAESAAAAFRAWSASNDWDAHLDPGSFRLLPALYKKLEAFAIDDPAIGRLRGLYRRSWYRNQRLLNGATRVIELLRCGNIETILLGGAALAARYYRHPGSRYLDHGGLLVRPHELERATMLLHEAGWRIDSDGAGGFVSCRDPNSEGGGNSYRLRSQPLTTAAGASVEWVWGSAARAEGASSPLPALGCTAMVLELLARMDEHEPLQTCVFVADAAVVLSRPELDSHLLLERARVHKLTASLAMTIDYLRTELCLPIAAPAIRPSARGSLTERLEWRLYTHKQHGRETFFAPVLAAAAGYLRRVNGLPPQQALARLPSFLREHYRSASLLRIAARLLRNGLRRSGRALGRSLAASGRYAEPDPQP